MTEKRERKRISREGFERWDTTIRSTLRRWINARARQQDTDPADVLDDVLKFAKTVLSNETKAERATPVARKAQQPGTNKP